MMKKSNYQTPVIDSVEITLSTAICSGGDGNPPDHTDKPGEWESKSPIRKLIVH